MKYINCFFAIAFFLAVIVSCDTTNVNGITEKTYPEASDYKKVNLSELDNDISTSDSVNIDLFVINLFECPKHANCILPDYLILSETLEKKDSLMLFVNKPSQFIKDEQYLLSLDISVNETAQSKRLSLLGYSTLK